MKATWLLFTFPNICQSQDFILWPSIMSNNDAADLTHENTGASRVLSGDRKSSCDNLQSKAAR